MPRLFALIALVAASLAGDELRLFEAHALNGTQGGERFTGSLEITPDARYTLRRTFASGREEVEEGRASVVVRDLVLRPETAEERVYVRDDSERYVRWRFRSVDHDELLVQPGRKEGLLALALRVVSRPTAARWLLEANVGVVDEEPRIVRSRQPSPRTIERLVREHGVRTVLSLNGRQDDEVWYVPDGDSPRAERARGPRRVTLEGFLAERGIAHVTVGMSASRAPSEDELAAVFAVLLDESRQPVLVHCKGGADRTGVICALYGIELLGQDLATAKATMRAHMWAADDGTEIQGAYLDLYQPGALRKLLEARGIEVPEGRE